MQSCGRRCSELSKTVTAVCWGKNDFLSLGAGALLGFPMKRCTVRDEKRMFPSASARSFAARLRSLFPVARDLPHEVLDNYLMSSFRYARGAELAERLGPSLAALIGHITPLWRTRK